MMRKSRFRHFRHLSLYRTYARQHTPTLYIGGSDGSDGNGLCGLRLAINPRRRACVNTLDVIRSGRRGGALQALSIAIVKTPLILSRYR